MVSALFYFAGGFYALGAFLVASMWNKFLLETLNYLEHYGLVRVPGEPIAPRHAWDSLSSFSHAALFELPWHADHHSRAGAKYPTLTASPDAPILPFGYLAGLPLVWLPPLWERLIKRGLAEWDQNKASPEERMLIG
jgi:alkane 1-monooxygenase